MRLDAPSRRPGRSGPCAPVKGLCAPGTARRIALASALATASILGAPGGAPAQQTVIIGGGNAGPAVSTGPAAAPGSGVVVNDNVLNSLGPGGPAPAVPYAAAPRTPVTGAPMTGGAVVTPEGTAGMPSNAYRVPGTGELVVTRPGTLLYPPMKPPHSHLTMAPPPGMMPPAASAAPMRAPEPAKAGAVPRSRIVAAPPKPAAPTVAQPAMPKAPAAPQVPKMAAQEPKTETAPTVPPAPSTPQMTAAPSKEPKTEAMPAAPAKAPPPAPSLAQELRTATPPPAAPAESAPAKAPEPPATKAAAAPSAAQQAARTTGEMPAPSGQVRLGFAAGSADLSDAAKEQLKGLAKRLNEDSGMRIQLLAYAAANGEGTSRARRLSLSRALAVRAFLIDQGVRSTRLDVRALGDKAGDGPADRVDIVPQ
jgi:outer membrane protein OmpA-like peptidoglycan-associated protein